MTYEITKDLSALLNAGNKASIAPAYREVIESLEHPGFSYNTAAMEGMTQTLFSNKLMIAHNLIHNAIDEAKGAARVNIIAERYADPVLKEKMRRHVGDELRHSKMFADCVGYTGYDMEQNDEPESEKEVDDVFEFDDDLKTFMCRVHSIEIRSWTMLRLYMDILRKKNDPSLLKLIPVFQQIMADEINHVRYTGLEVSKWIAEDPSVAQTLFTCFQHTNRETWHDLANMANYLADTFPSLVPDTQEAEALAA